MLMTRRKLCQLLNDARIYYIDQGNNILVTFTCLDSDIIERGTEVDLIVTWDENFVSITLPLIELDEYDEIPMDPVLMESFLRANFDLDICKFGLGPNSLLIIVDLDARNLQFGEINSAIDSLLIGFEMYVRIINEWFNYLIESDSFMPVQYYGDSYGKHYGNDTQYTDDLNSWIYTKDTTKDLIMRTIAGIVKFGAVAGVASLAGVPAVGIGTILAALASQK